MSSFTTKNVNNVISFVIYRCLCIYIVASNRSRGLTLATATKPVCEPRSIVLSSPATALELIDIHTNAANLRNASIKTEITFGRSGNGVK